MNFSVLLTVYINDDPDFFAKSLKSIFQQTLIPSEVVIVSDGSLTQPLYEIINTFEKQYQGIIKTLYLPNNIGTGLAINEGLKICSFDLVAKMDSDDINFNNRFEKQIEIFQSFPEIDIVGSSIVEFENNDINNIVSCRKLPQFHEDIIKYAKRRCPMNQPSVMYRKSSILDCGGYRKFTFGEDYDLWVRAIMNDCKFYNIQEPLLYFRSNINTIKKRGGWWYLKIDLSHHYDFYKMGFLTVNEFLFNSFVRIFIRLTPSRLRKILYLKLLRSTK